MENKDIEILKAKVDQLTTNQKSIDLRKLEVSIKVQRAEMQGYKKMQTRLMKEVTRINEKLLPLAELRIIKKLNNKLKNELVKFMETKAISEANMKRTNSIFVEMNKRHIAFKEFKNTEKHLKKEYSKFMLAFEQLEVKFEDLVDQNDLGRVKKRLDSIDRKIEKNRMKIKQCARKSTLKRLKKKVRHYV